MNLTPGLNFINVLRTAFTLAGPKSVRIQSSSQYLFTFLGYTGAKAACRMLMKLTLGLLFIEDVRTYGHDQRMICVADSFTVRFVFAIDYFSIQITLRILKEKKNLT